MRGLVGFPAKPFKNCQNWKGYFDFRGLVGFLTETIPKGMKIEKVSSICVVWQDFLQNH